MKEIYLRFMAPVNSETTDLLFQFIDKAISEKYEKLHLLLSSPGGSVFHGLSTYNFLRGIPIKVHTYNFGSVDSIGVVVYCAGEKRFSVPHARFLIHGVRFGIRGNSSFDEKQIEEHLKALQIDQENISKVIADTVEEPVKKIVDDMHNRTTLNPNQAKDYKLVHEIKSELFPIDAEFAVIREPLKHSNQASIQNTTTPLIQGYTQSIDLNIGTS